MGYCEKFGLKEYSLYFISWTRDSAYRSHTLVGCPETPCRCSVTSIWSYELCATLLLVNKDVDLKEIFAAQRSYIHLE